MDAPAFWIAVFAAATFGFYGFIALTTRAHTTREFYVADRRVNPFVNGMATAAAATPAAAALSLSGVLAASGYGGSAYLMGWTGGFVLLAMVIAPYLRRFNQFTVPDFIGERYASDLARLIAVVCVVFISFSFLAAQLHAVGVVASNFLPVGVAQGVVAAAAVVFLTAAVGGMKGVTAAQTAQYCVLIFAVLAPAIFLSLAVTGEVAPQLGFLGAARGGDTALIEKLDASLVDLGFAAYTASTRSAIDMLAVTAALMFGVAGAPHIIVRFFTAPRPAGARWSAFWALFFIAVFFTTAGAAAALVRLNFIETVDGAAYAHAPDGQRAPEWVREWEDMGFLAWTDRNGDALMQHRAGLSLVRNEDGEIAVDEVTFRPEIVANEARAMAFEGGPPAFATVEEHEALPGDDVFDGRTVIVTGEDGAGVFAWRGGEWRELSFPERQNLRAGDIARGSHGQRAVTNAAPAAAGETFASAEFEALSVVRQESYRRLLADNEIYVDPDAMMFAPAFMARLPDWTIGLVLAGVVAAALSTAAGLLLVTASAISQDFCRKLVYRSMNDRQELFIARLAVAGIAIAAVLAGLNPPDHAVALAASAFGLAAATFFPAIALGVFWKRMNATAAVAGMTAGFIFTGGYVAAYKVFAVLPDTPQGWFLGISPEGAGALGMVLNIAVSIAVARVTPPPSRDVQALVDRIRSPILR